MTVRWLALWLLTLTLVAPAHAAPSQGRAGARAEGAEREHMIARVLTAVRRHEGEARLLGKLQQKLATLSDREVRVLARLADLALDEAGRPRASIAFFLMTALIVLE